MNIGTIGHVDHGALAVCAWALVKRLLGKTTLTAAITKARYDWRGVGLGGIAQWGLLSFSVVLGVIVCMSTLREMNVSGEILAAKGHLRPCFWQRFTARRCILIVSL